jgi:MFS family permease
MGAGVAARLGHAGWRMLARALGGAQRARVVVVLAAVLGLSSADASTVGAAATQLRHALGIGNTDVGLLVTVTSLIAAVTSLPFGVLADRVRRTWTLAAAVALWGVAMVWSASITSFGQLLVARVFLGAVTAAAGPLVASLVGDYFPASERGKTYGYILAGELAGAGLGFAVTGDVATLSWRAAFLILALPALALAMLVWRLPEPARGGADALVTLTGERPVDTNRDRHTDAQLLSETRGIEPEREHVLTEDPRRLSLLAAARYVLRIKTNVALILASVFGYYFMAGLQTFGVEFVTRQYRIAQVLSTLVLLAVGAGGILGVLVGGALGDRLLHHGYLNGRIIVSASAAGVAVVLFAPAIFTRSALTALPYVTFAAFALAAQQPPLNAARLDIVVPLLWGRAEGVRTFLRALAQAIAPLVFGGLSDHLFGGGRSGLQWTFAIMLVPLAASSYILFRALRTYPRDVSTAAASAGHDGQTRAKGPRTPGNTRES